MSSLLILLCSCGGDPANREPTEEEMLGVVQVALDDYNYGLEATEKACRAGDHRNDPVLAMQCLVILGGSGGRGGVRAEIARFRKIGCKESQSAPGYVCDYVLGIRTFGLTLPPSLAAVMGNGELVQKRFVWTGENWLAL